ncbi:hypothetical protein [Tabrizicola sp.]|uniref:hypothetical protein n=1 Tax=Tabrizicola sp. TaxID=2005166 RepID=UPI00286D393E|nr:hypothetical protein [Tabrizicola sp.]
MRPILFAVLTVLPMTAYAGANPEAVYRSMITGAWAMAPEACGTIDAFTFSHGQVQAGIDVCTFSAPISGPGGTGVQLNMSCTESDDPTTAIPETFVLTLDQVDPGLPDPGDILTLTGTDSLGVPITLRRCP